MSVVIRVQNVNKSFGPVRAVVDLSFEVQEQTCYGFLGPNGAGKTTMMKMIYARALRDNDSQAVIDIFGFDPAREELKIKYLSGVVQQEDSLDEELNVIQNLRIYSRFYNIPKAVACERIDFLLDFMELTKKADSKIREISGGMKRRLVIARALLNNPKLLILDEPTTGLDPQVRHLIWDKLRGLKKQGTTILLTTHYMEEAYQLCDRMMIMHKGSRIMEGPPRELIETNIEKYVLELIYTDTDQSILENPLVGRTRVDRTNEMTRLYADDIDHLRRIADLFEGGNYNLRQSNLEDVFLKATGSSLNVEQ